MLQGLLMAALVAAGMPQETSEGSWEAEFRASRVHMNIRMDEGRGYSNYGRTMPLSDLAALRRDGRNVSFELRRAAGTFRFDGVGNDRNASGRYVFQTDAAYRRALDGLGVGGLSQRRMLTLAIHDVKLDDVRYLKRSVRGELDGAGLVRMLDHGADPEFVRGIYAAGFKDLSAEELVRTRDHGVTSDFALEMRELGYKDVSHSDLIRLRNHGVTVGYARRANRELKRTLSVDELVRLRSRGEF